MPTYLLDTNACIDWLRSKNEQLVRRLEAASPEDLALCSVVKGELLTGAFKSMNRAHHLSQLNQLFSLFESYAFDDTAAHSYGEIRSALESAGTPIGANDLLIAAIAIAHGLVVVTRNLREFQRVPGLKVEDWST